MVMDTEKTGNNRTLSAAQKKHALFLKQKALLELFAEKNAITKAQYEKSLGDLREKMGEEESIC